MNTFFKITTVVFLLLNQNINAQSAQPTFQWTKPDGEAQYDYGYGIATDSIGNVYVAGKFEMDANFGGNTWVQCAGNHDIYIAKYGPLGDFKWVRTAGGVWGDYSRAVTCDAAGNVYITGEIEMNCEFFGSGITLYSHGDNDVFVTKYNTDGDLLWAKKLGGGPKSDRGYGITNTADGIYVTGNFQLTCVFNENITITPNGLYDIFVAKYSLNGDFQWIRTGGGTGNDEGWAISSDPDGNVYATGYFSGTANFSGTNISSSGGADIFIAKYNSAGTLIWVTKAGGSGNDYGRGIAVDKLSRVFITGGFRSRCYFGSIRLTAASSNDDIFIASYNSSGGAVWARRAGGSYGDIGKAIAVDPSSNVSITGYFAGTATFGNTNITGIDGSEIYFASYDAMGNFKWVLKATGVTDATSSGGLQESGLSIAADRWNNVFASGCYRSNSTFGNTTLAAWDHTDVFTTKIGITNTKPDATIIAPVAGTLYRAGDIINFSGNATDPQDGNLPAAAYNWKVDLHSGSQIISGPAILPGIKNGFFTVPSTGEASANVFYRLTLVVADVQGLKDTAYIDISPITSTLSLTSQPSGLQILLDGQSRTTPYVVSAVSGMTRTLGITTPQTLNGISYTFDHWLHGGTASQNISVTDSNKTYTAIFNASGAGSSCTSSGTITRDYWANFTGLITELPVNTTPTSTILLTKFEGPSQVADNYGSRIRGYICPPSTGNYVFWIASDNKSELWLSTNDQPANKIKIAYASSYTLSREWTKYPSQQSIPISLLEGTKYYIEAIHKEAADGDNLAVGWQLPNGVLERPIPGTRLSPFGVPLSVNVILPMSNSSFNVGSTIAIQAAASGGTGTIQKVEFFSGNTKLGEDLTSPYNYSWNNTAAGLYSLTAKVTDSGNNTALSPSINITVTNSLTTTIISPANNSAFNFGSAIAIQATASGGTGTIQKVEFFADTTKLGESSISPYSFTWNNANSGSYALTVKATDNQNNSIVSAVVNISINENNPPIVSITSPVDGTIFSTPANIGITVDAISNGGNITKVEFFQDTTKIGEDLTVPFQYTWMNITSGNYTLKAVATDNSNRSGISQPINIKVATCTTPAIIPLGSLTMCSDSVTLKTNANPGNLYQWIRDGINIAGATNFLYTASVAGNYQVKVIQGSCISWSAPVSVKIQSGLSASITPGGATTFCSSGELKLFANTCSGYTYQWKKDNVAIPGATSSTYIATTSGSYQIKITLAGVSAWSALVTVTVNACRESETNQNDSDEDQINSELPASKNRFQMNVYPNPGTGLFTIALNIPLIKEERVQMKIVNILGQEVYNKESVIKDNYFKEIVELDKALPTGVYTLQVIIGNNIENTSMILSR
ncbi:MAG: Ig-like domain-containing protein [Bacteroidota bacterium]